MRPTSQELHAMLTYDPETGLFVWRERPVAMFSHGDKGQTHNAAKWNRKFAGRPAFITDNGFGYRKAIIWMKPYQAHRVAWAMIYGEWPTMEIDHINGNRSDNRIENLRQVTPAENQRNQKTPAHNTSGHVGVIWFPQTNRWQVRIGKRHVGYFKDFSEACAARKSAEAEHGYHANHGRAA